MSIKGFSVGGVVQRYDYTALDNLPQGQGVSDDLKAALLQIAQKVAYIDDQGQTYYDALYDALYPEKTLLSITANFQQGQAVVYNTDSLDSLKQYLTVTAIYDDASTETAPSSAYTLSGTLTTGTSVITVTYEGKTDAFNVVVTAAPMSFTVTNTLTGCTTSNSATSVLEDASYTAVITASSGYTLVGATASITMGGQDITTSAYSGGIISINNVTGALVIAVSAVERVLSSITAAYTQSGTVYDTDSLDSLKADLVVTANYSDGYTQTVPADDYTLSGTLTEGTSTITVSYGGKTTTFDVTVTAGPLYLFDDRDFTIATVSNHREYLQVSNGNHFKFYNYRGGGNDWVYASPTNTAKTTPSWPAIFSVQAGDAVVLKLKNGYVETARTDGKVFINTSLRNTSGARLWGWTSAESDSPLYIDTSVGNRVDFTELTMNITPDSSASIGCLLFYSWGDFASGTTQYTQITFEADWEVWVNGVRYI